MEPNPNSFSNPDSRAKRVLKALKQEYVVVGKSRVKAWQAWLVIGIAAGIAAGIIFIANRSGEVEQGRAASADAITVELDLPSYYPDFLRHPQKFFSGRTIRIVTALRLAGSSILLSSASGGALQSLNVTQSFEKPGVQAYLFTIPNDTPTGQYTITLSLSGQNLKIPLAIYGLDSSTASANAVSPVLLSNASPAIMFRATICDFCSWEMVFAGDPGNPKNLFHVGTFAINGFGAGGLLSRSSDAGRTWNTASIDSLAAYPDPKIKYGGDPKLRVLGSGSLLLQSMFWYPFSELGYLIGGMLLRGAVSGGLTGTIVKNVSTTLTPNPYDFFDYGKIAIDNRLNPSTAGRIYVAGDGWLDSAGADWVLLYESQDGGATFREYGIYPFLINGGSIIQSLTLGNDGTLYAAANTYFDGLYAPTVLRFSSVEPLVVVASSSLPNASASYYPPRISKFSPRAWDAYFGPEIVSDNNPASPFYGRLYALWSREAKLQNDANFEYKSFGYDFNIYESHSEDRGTTWSTPVAVNDDRSGGDQLFPSTAVSSDGVLHVAFVDHRNNQNSPVFDIYYAKSANGGVSFSKNLRVNSATISNSVIGGRTIGDYLDMIAAYPGVVYIAYPCGGQSAILGPTSVCLAEVNPSLVR